MLTCTFESGSEAHLRHVVAHAVCEKDGKILLVKRAETLSVEPGKWSLPGGFLNRDETAAQCALRELYEETGWEGAIRSVFIIKTDPKRPGEDRQNVPFSFLVNPGKHTGMPDHESSEITWMPCDNLPDLSGFAFDHGEVVSYYLRYRESPFTLPVLL